MSEVVSAESNPSELPPLHVAVKEGNREIVKMLLKNGANPDGSPDEASPLFFAAGRGYRGIVELLLQNGANVEGSAGTPRPLCAAVYAGNSDIVELLLQNGADMDSDFYNVFPLSFAIYGGHENIVKLLLQNGVNMNGVGQNDVTVHLGTAIKRGRWDIVELLLHNGAVIERDISYLFLLTLAAEGGHLEIIKVFLSHGARLNIKSNDNRSSSKAADPKEPLLFQHPQVFQHLLKNCFCNPEFMNAMGIAGGQRFDDDPSINSLLPHTYLRHLIKIAAANLHPLVEEVSDKTEFWQLADEDWDSFKSECISEVAQMKKTTVCNAGITFFNILMKDTYQLAHYLKNSNISQVLNSDNLNDRFPKYAVILKCQFQKGNQRLLAVEKGIKVCYSLSSLFKKLPREISEVILNYLSLEDLFILTKECP